jgi:hypothetical protein
MPALRIIFATRLAHSTRPCFFAETLGCLIRVWRSASRPSISASTTSFIALNTMCRDFAIENKGCFLNLWLLVFDLMILHLNSDFQPLN